MMARDESLKKGWEMPKLPHYCTIDSLTQGVLSVPGVLEASVTEFFPGKIMLSVVLRRFDGSVEPFRTKGEVINLVDRFKAHGVDVSYYWVVQDGPSDGPSDGPFIKRLQEKIRMAYGTAP